MMVSTALQSQDFEDDVSLLSGTCTRLIYNYKKSPFVNRAGRRTVIYIEGNKVKSKESYKGKQLLSKSQYVYEKNGFLKLLRSDELNQQSNFHNIDSIKYTYFANQDGSVDSIYEYCDNRLCRKRINFIYNSASLPTSYLYTM